VTANGPAVPTDQAAACWLAAAGDFAYTDNAGSGSIGEFAVAPKAILGTAYELATGQRLAPGDFEGGKTGAVRVLGKLGLTVQERRPAS
jgi:hypothetical protein